MNRNPRFRSSTRFLAYRHDDGQHADMRSRFAPIALVALFLLGPGKVTSAQDPQSRTLEQWLAQLKDADAAKRRQAVVALGSFGPDLTKAMIAQVGELLKDSDQGVRHAAALSLGQFRPGMPKWRLPISGLPSRTSLRWSAERPSLRWATWAHPRGRPFLSWSRPWATRNETVRHAAAYALGQRRRGSEGRGGRPGKGAHERCRL